MSYYGSIDNYAVNFLLNDIFGIQAELWKDSLIQFSGSQSKRALLWMWFVSTFIVQINPIKSLLISTCFELLLNELAKI